MNYREPNPLTSGTSFDISIQASACHYSTPREDLPNMSDYTEVEIALFTKEGDWINPYTSQLIADFPRLEELLESYEDSNETAVGYYIPVDLVQDLVAFANNDIKETK